MKKKTKNDSSHKTVMHEHVIKRSYCDDKNCKFYGKLAEQGVCYSQTSTPMSKYFSDAMKAAERMLSFNPKHNCKNLSQKQLIKRLEDEVVCYFMNYSNILDELVWLRGENAKLRGKLGIFKED